jgi:hypothetical protein
LYVCFFVFVLFYVFFPPFHFHDMIHLPATTTIGRICGGCATHGGAAPFFTSCRVAAAVAAAAAWRWWSWLAVVVVVVQISLTGDYILSELVSPGQSGQFFYFSYDLRFMLKTITRGEAKFLKAILPKYYNVRPPPAYWLPPPHHLGGGGARSRAKGERGAPWLTWPPKLTVHHATLPGVASAYVICDM